MPSSMPPWGGRQTGEEADMEPEGEGTIEDLRALQILNAVRWGDDDRRRESFEGFDETAQHVMASCSHLPSDAKGKLYADMLPVFYDDIPE